MMPAPPSYPISLHLSGRSCLVVGAGRVGARRVRGLLEADAAVVVVDPHPVAEIQARARAGDLVWRPRTFDASDVVGCLLVFAATASQAVNRAVGEAARRAGALFCGVEALADRDFEVPGVVRRGDLQVTVSTGGASPAFARMVRERLDECLGEEYAVFLAFLKDLRPRVLAQFPDSPDKRRAVWQKLVTPDLMALVREGHWDRVESQVAACLLSS